jgi:hypothetical protein
MSLEDTRLYNDMVLLYKVIHGASGLCLDGIGQSLMSGITRGAGLRLRQRRPANKRAASMFSFRAAADWNALPLAITSIGSLSIFKNKLRDHILKNSTFILEN